jgi:predicted AlkP superfamily phosphohydrolase/phosphomutase
MNHGDEKLLVFGMDGATWEILEPLLARGDMPTLARIASEGAVGPLASTVHPHSATAWTSFLTGMNPGRHGIYDFLRRRPESYDMEVVSTRMRGGRALWRILSERGVTCGIVNVPMTYPPEKVAGYFVSGTFSADPISHVTYPRALAADIERHLGHRYVVDAHLSDLTERVENDDDPILQRFLDRLLQVEQERCEMSVLLLQRYRPRFAVHVVTATDRAQHSFWRQREEARAGSARPFHDAIEKTYRAADEALARLWEAMGEETTVVVMSDHGGGPLARVLSIDAWLEAEGYLKTTRPARFSPQALRRGVFRGAFRLAKRVLPRAARSRIKGGVPGARGVALRYLRAAPIDWERTRAFGEGTFGSISVNVRGEEPHGCVEPGAEYDALRREIRAKIESLVDPKTGEPAVEHTYAREELYAGERLAEAPDILIVLRRGYQMVGDFLTMAHGDPSARRAVFADAEQNRFRLNGTHTLDGVLLARGAGIAPGIRVTSARIVDLAPTILHRFGIPPPAEMDGRIVQELAGPNDA